MKELGKTKPLKRFFLMNHRSSCEFQQYPPSRLSFNIFFPSGIFDHELQVQAPFSTKYIPSTFPGSPEIASHEFPLTRKCGLSGFFSAKIGIFLRRYLMGRRQGGPNVLSWKGSNPIQRYCSMWQESRNGLPNNSVPQQKNALTEK